MEFALLAVAGFLAGLIDAVAGGGGLVQIPALFSAYPNIAPATLIGTNKVASMSGTATAAVRYGRTVRIYWVIPTQTGPELPWSDDETLS